MKKFQIFRNLPFKEWHVPYTNGGDSKKTECNRFECNCPYGNHRDVRYLDYKDPLHLEKILKLQPGSKLLTFSKAYEIEQIAYHEFTNFNWCAEAVQLRYKMEGLPDQYPFMPSFDGTKYQGGEHRHYFSEIRYIAVIENTNDPFIPIGFAGDKLAYIKTFCYLTGFDIKRALCFFDKLDRIRIPKNKKIDCSKYDHL